MQMSLSVQNVSIRSRERSHFNSGTSDGWHCNPEASTTRQSEPTHRILRSMDSCTYSLDRWSKTLLLLQIICSRQTPLSCANMDRDWEKVKPKWPTAELQCERCIKSFGCDFVNDEMFVQLWVRSSLLLASSRQLAQPQLKQQSSMKKQSQFHFLSLIKKYDYY